MATPPISDDEVENRCAMVEKYLQKGYAPPLTFREGLKIGRPRGMASTMAATELGISRSSLDEFLRVRARKEVLDPSVRNVNWQLYQAPGGVEEAESELTEKIVARLRRAPATLDELSQLHHMTRGAMLDVLDQLRDAAHSVLQIGDRWTINTQAPAFTTGDMLEYESRDDNTFVFGVTADNHLGSKYERLDCLHDVYARFEQAGVDRVFNCGNWIEGEARFNLTDIHTHGLDSQIRYLVSSYPRSTVTTYAVAGDDHEGWYAQRMGIDIGAHAERAMREAGRQDWVNLGYMEAHVRLVNKNTGKSAVMAVVHGGGGSSYADSYVVQKILESLDGGEKPAVALYGHYHKMLSGEYRNVWWVLVPSTKDQDPFMRKKKIRSVVGGGIITLEQDPETGAIIGMTPKLWRYFAKGYYNDRWSHSHDINLPERDTK